MKKIEFSSKCPICGQKWDWSRASWNTLKEEKSLKIKCKGCKKEFILAFNELSERTSLTLRTQVKLGEHNEII